MKIEIIEIGGQSEHVYIEKCSRAALNKNLSKSHVLAQYKETTLYFTTNRNCTYSSFVCWDNHLLWITCILNKIDLECMHNQLQSDDSDNYEYAVELVYEYVNYALDCYTFRNENPPY